MGKLGLVVIAVMGAACSVAPTSHQEGMGTPPPSPPAVKPHKTEFLPAAPLLTGKCTWNSEWHTPARPFDQFLPSWNVDTEHSFRVEVQLRGPEVESQWLDVGGWGAWPQSDLFPTKFEGGKVAVDIVKLTSHATDARIRIRTQGPASIDRVTFCYTDSALLADRTFDEGKNLRVAPLSVPGRRQTVESAELAPRICSPTSVSMVLDYHGTSKPTAQVAAELFDVENDIYGNWNRAVQGAARFGVKGHLTRINDWDEAWRLLDAGIPLIASIGVKPGQLTGAPYPSTNGHLIVITGLDGKGFANVQDPAAAPGEPTARTYALEELDEVWLRRGGTTYVLDGVSHPGHL